MLELSYSIPDLSYSVNQFSNLIRELSYSITEPCKWISLLSNSTNTYRYIWCNRRTPLFNKKTLYLD